METQNSDREVDAKKITPKVMVFLGIFCLMAVAFVGGGVYETYKSAKRVYNISQTYEDLKERSEAHSILVKAYEECRQNMFGDTQQGCVIKMKEYAEIEGLSEQFNIVYQDIKTELWTL